ncbi:hypothetical protein C8046_05765 [Serinibacter arcticus]|uniref:DUF222 domain-containing protein n=1 Tax=Serinibacter arcticus TaxID=1655435 RepID=A0A2U1ZTI5_9MICO|nr:HNH endonuclease signature motif containing protein [Serinibacter arcticus]PWD50243.1 hypothetical protein C8046_05765 [Serinibacter arcticus]
MFDDGSGATPTVTPWGLGLAPGSGASDPESIRVRLGLHRPEDGGPPTQVLERLPQLSDFAHLMALDPGELLETAAAFAAVAGWAEAGLRATAARLHIRHGVIDADRLAPQPPGTPVRVERGGPAADELAMRLGVSRQRAARLVGEGRLLEGILHPVGTALASGAIDAGKAAIFADLLGAQEPAVCFAVTEQVLPDAPGLPHHALKKRIQAVLIQTDPTTAHRRAVLAATRRRVEHPRLLPDGQASLRVIAPALDIAAIYTATEGAAKAARAAGDPRLLDQLRADALTTLATTALTAGSLTAGPSCAQLLTGTTTETSPRDGAPVGTGDGDGAPPLDGAEPDPRAFFADLIEDEVRGEKAREREPSPLAQVRRTLDATIAELGARARRRLGYDHQAIDQGPPSIASSLLTMDPPRPQPTDVGRPNEVREAESFRPFMPFSGTSATLTLALAPAHLTEPEPDHIDPVDPWEHDLALTTDGESARRFETYEAPERCRPGVDVPELLGHAPLDPTTARKLAIDPPRWLTVTTALADTLEQADRERDLQRARPVHDDTSSPDNPDDPGGPSPVPRSGEETGKYWPAGFDPAPQLATPGYRPGAELGRLVRALHPTCIAPACTVASSACDNDHAVEWPAGPTDAPNLRPLCRHHHKLKTHHGHRYRITPDGSTIWTTPTGHRYHRPPAGSSRLIATPRRRGPQEAA